MSGEPVFQDLINQTNPLMEETPDYARAKDFNESIRTFQRSAVEGRTPKANVGVDLSLLGGGKSAAGAAGAAGADHEDDEEGEGIPAQEEDEEGEEGEEEGEGRGGAAAAAAATSSRKQPLPRGPLTAADAENAARAAKRRRKNKRGGDDDDEEEDDDDEDDLRLVRVCLATCDPLAHYSPSAHPPCS